MLTESPSWVGILAGSREGRWGTGPGAQPRIGATSLE